MYIMNENVNNMEWANPQRKWVQPISIGKPDCEWPNMTMCNSWIGDVPGPFSTLSLY